MQYIYIYMYILHPIITLSKIYFWFSSVSYSFLSLLGTVEVVSFR